MRKSNQIFSFIFPIQHGYGIGGFDIHWNCDESPQERKIRRRTPRVASEDMLLGDKGKI